MKERLEELVQRAQQTLPARVVMAYGESQAGNYALAVAFAGFMAMFPMILGVLSIIGLAIRDPQTEKHMQALVLQLFPLSAQPELQRALEGVKQSAGWLGLLSLAGIIWGATSIFGTLEFALTQIFGTKQRDMVRQRLMGLIMMLVLVVAIVAIVVINAGAAFIPIGWIAWTAGFIAGAALMILLLISLYRFVPNRTFRIQDVLPGAILAGVLIEGLSLAFPLYVRIAGGFNTYGAQFGLFFLLATWFYLLSQVVLLGAVFNRIRMGDPGQLGLVASPAHESRDFKRPVDAIEEKKPSEPASQAPPRRTFFQSTAIVVVGALALASRLVRRRQARTAP